MRTIKAAALMALVALFSCETDKNVAPVFETFFTKYYGADGNQEAVDLVVNPDGTMVMLGNTTSQISSNPTPYILKVDGMGNVLWQRHFGVANGEKARDIEPDGSGGLLVVSNVLGGPGSSQIRLFRLDQNGNSVDSLLIPNIGESGGNVAQTGISVTRILDGSFLVVGSAGPEYVTDPELLNPETDEADLLAYHVDNDLQDYDPLVSQGGEHVGQLVKAFQSKLPGLAQYLMFGDSDRPFLAGGQYKQSFEVLTTNESGIFGGKRPLTGPVSEIQVASSAIETSLPSQESYLMIGTSYTGSSSNIFITQYVNDTKNITVRIDKTIGLNKRSEGVAVATSPAGFFYLLGNAFQDNNNRDIVLVKMGADGEQLGEQGFGSLEGDDLGAAVSVLADERIAVLATIQLETQKKMALFILNPDGTFTNN